MNTVLTRAAILGFDDRQIEAFAVPEWGGDVYLRAFSGAEGKRISEIMSDADDDHAKATVVVAGVCDANGKPIFTDKDISKLMQKSLRPLTRIANRILVINGFLESREDTEKNSVQTPT